MNRHKGHGPKANMHGAYDPNKLGTLRKTLRDVVREIPELSFRYIDYHLSWSAWRVELPGVLGKKTVYFRFSDYGSPEWALIEAQYFRDEEFAKAGMDIYMRVRQRFSKRARNSILSINEAVDHRNGNRFIIGTWMIQDNGVPQLKKVKRSFGRIRSRQEAWDEVEAIVRKAMTAEATRRRRTASVV